MQAETTNTELYIIHDKWYQPPMSEYSKNSYTLPNKPRTQISIYYKTQTQHTDLQFPLRVCFSMA